MPVEDFIITVFCWVSKIFEQEFKDAKLRSRGFKPKLCDAEVITMEVVGEFLEIDTDKKIWLYFKNHWQAWFPALGCRTTLCQTSL